MAKTEVSNKALYEFCTFYRQQFGKIQDAIRFKNELRLRFYHQAKDSDRLFEQCIKQRFIVSDAGNIIIKVGRKND